MVISESQEFFLKVQPVRCQLKTYLIRQLIVTPFNVHTLNKISSTQKINSLPIYKDKMIPNLYLANPTSPAKLSQRTINISDTKTTSRTKNTNPFPSMNNLTMKNNPSDQKTTLLT